MKHMMSNIEKTLKPAGKQGLAFLQLRRKCKVKPSKYRTFEKALENLQKDGKLQLKKGRYVLAKSAAQKGYPATIVKVASTFGFARLEDEREVFIPGRLLLGTLPGDQVMITVADRGGQSPEGKVLSITAYGESTFTGKLIQNDYGEYMIQADSLLRDPLVLEDFTQGDVQVGDKVLCKISYRGKRHFDHRVKVLMSYGSAERASVCAEAYLAAQGITGEFPAEVQQRADQLNQQGITDKDLKHRTDLRNDCIFTIDGADSLDLDDAISLDKFDDCYVLGVHIADVSHYVRYKDEVDVEALQRGTSVYYANRVIPMLPKALSNGICSLSPQQDRLALSAIMTLDLQGNLRDMKFEKTVICSRIKGVYTEINDWYDGTASDEIKQKYQAVSHKLELMKELALLRMAKKKERGAPEITSTECKVYLAEDGTCSHIQERTTGFSENLIEEFMLLANQAAAMAGRMNELPFIYRTHDEPTAEKVERLNTVLQAVGFRTTSLPTPVKPGVLAEILREANASFHKKLLNLQVLRTMSKAQYSEEPLGHFGLALDDYAHFTSPIRRYPDLMVHRMLTAQIKKKPLADLQKKYGKYVVRAAKLATQTEIQAMQAERTCTDFYKAEYVGRELLGQTVQGTISGVASHGVYVELEQPVEGLVRFDQMPKGEYSFDEIMEYKNITTGERFRLGDKKQVKIVKVDVNSGNIDFVFVNNQ